MSQKRYTCKDCKYYKPVDETKGDCFGHEVPADMPAEQCPAKALNREKKAIMGNKENSIKNI